MHCLVLFPAKMFQVRMILSPPTCNVFRQWEDSPPLECRLFSSSVCQILIHPSKVTQVLITSMRLQNREIYLLVVDTASKSLDVVDVSMFRALVAKYLRPAKTNDVAYLVYTVRLSKFKPRTPTFRPGIFTSSVSINYMDNSCTFCSPAPVRPNFRCS
jgi:hypothetical protein